MNRERQRIIIDWSITVGVLGLTISLLAWMMPDFWKNIGTRLQEVSVPLRARLVAEVYVDDDQNYEISYGDSFYSATNFSVHLDGDQGVIGDKNQDGRAEDYVYLDKTRSYSYTKLDDLAEEYVDITSACSLSCKKTVTLVPGGQAAIKLLVSNAPKATLRVSAFLDFDGDRQITDTDPLFVNNLGIGTFTVTLKLDDTPNLLLELVDNDDKDMDARFGIIEHEIAARTGYSYVAISFFEDPMHTRERYEDVTSRCSAGCISGVHNLPPRITGQIRLLVATVEEPATPLPVPSQTGGQSAYADIEVYVDTDGDGQLNPQLDHAYTAGDFEVPLIVMGSGGMGPQFEVIARDSDDGSVDGRVRKEVFHGEFYVLSVVYSGTIRLAEGFEDITPNCYGPPRAGFSAGCRQGGDLPSGGEDPYVARVRLLVRERKTE